MGDSYISGRLPIRVQQELALSNDSDVIAYSKALDAYKGDLTAYVEQMYAENGGKRPEEMPKMRTRYNQGRVLHFSPTELKALYRDKAKAAALLRGEIPEEIRAHHDQRAIEDMSVLNQAMKPGYVGPAPTTDFGSRTRSVFLDVLNSAMQERGSDANSYLSIPEFQRRFER